MSQRKTWLQEEDSILKMLIEERKVKGWASIARIMAEEFGITGRSGKQCRERYHNHLNGNIKQGPWCKQEEQLLVDLQNSMGNRWADISRAIAGRSQNSVKNKYFSIVRKGVRVLNLAIRRHLKKYKELQMGAVRQIVDFYDPSAPKELTTPEHLSSEQIKKRLLFYGLRDQFLPFDNEDYADIKRVIDQIRTMKKSMGGHKWKAVLPVSAEESVSREEKENVLQMEEEQVKVEDTRERGEISEGRGSVNDCILGFKRISLQSYGLQPLQEQELQYAESHQCGHVRTPQMSKNLSNFSNRSNLQIFQNRSQIDHRNTQFLRKQSTLRSFELPQVEHIKTPFVMIDSPHFDQIKSSYNSWSYLFQH